MIVNFWPQLFQQLRSLGRVARAAQLRLVCLIAVLAIGLSGCAESDLGIRFDSPSQGVITQRIYLGERLLSLSNMTVKQLQKAIAQQTQSVGGSVKQLPNQTLLISIPFRDAIDLEQKFNRFFKPQAKLALALSDFPTIPTQLAVRRNNFLLLERTRLSYDVDLRNLGLTGSTGQLLFSPGSLINLTFHLDTPWNVKVLAPKQQPNLQQQGRQLNWQLLPGEENHLDVAFWMPNPIGLGAIVIGAIVALGYYLRYPTTMPESMASRSSLSSTNTQ
ncbi:MAG TPA: DUF3153 domain-containing protein [Leptolyngbyaceae cyanobacterium M33_DOE_097]|uniref:DUF3153 domain-containing protein n=1 Tax=Oscillatoriales cyanobacterium SpSt-418 TaxID=2282169 RepID=A0A7C3KGL5_9CYAN|nr:DUF3153 domain-containing protein [Leptolyngbyaceae cyanobacterium M33_DOE_097]